MRGIRDGKTRRRIAHDMGIAEQTVRNHITGIHHRLGVSSTIEAIWLLRRELET